MYYFNFNILFNHLILHLIQFHRQPRITITILLPFLMILSNIIFLYKPSSHLILQRSNNTIIKTTLEAFNLSHLNNINIYYLHLKDHHLIKHMGLNKSSIIPVYSYTLNLITAINQKCILQSLMWIAVIIITTTKHLITLKHTTISTMDIHNNKIIHIYY